MLSTRIAAVVILAGFASPMYGQNTVSAAGGPVIPLGTAGKALSTGYHATLALTAKPPLATVGIRLEAMFNSFGFKDTSTGTRTERILAAVANATVSNPSTPLRTFYLVGGVGIYNTKTVGSVDTKGNNDIGFNVGLGMNLTTAVGTFVEARYHHIPSEASTTRLVPISFGLRF